MPQNLQLTLAAAAVALCAIIGVYYIWVRRLGNKPEEKQPVHSRQA